MKRLYHGTNIEFPNIDLSKCLPFKDFGRGFYVTELYNQAEEMAKRKSARWGSPVVLEYEIEDSILEGNTECTIKEFKEADEEWARFILANRERSNPPFSHPYDIVIGPVADDGVAYILNRYLEGSFSMTDVVRELKYSKLSHQICFATERAVINLKRVGHE